MEEYLRNQQLLSLSKIPIFHGTRDSLIKQKSSQRLYIPFPEGVQVALSLQQDSIRGGTVTKRLCKMNLII